MLTICMDMNMTCIGSSPFALFTHQVLKSTSPVAKYEEDTACTGVNL